MADRRLLVVDDSVTMQKVIELALARTMFTITKLHDYHKTKHLLQEQNFAAILVNLQLMKGMDPQHIHELRIRPNGDVLPLIILTGSFGPTHDHVLKQFEKIYFLQKPFDAKDLLAMLSEALGTSSASFTVATPVNPTPIPAASMATDVLVETGRKGRKAFADVTPAAATNPAVSLPDSADDVPVARSGASSFSIPAQELERLVNNFLAPKIEKLVKSVLDQYCADKFDSLAREVIENELRRLATERARHLVES